MRRVLSTINHQLTTRRFRRWIPLILIAGGITAFVLWPRPALISYTTPPLDSKGTRIQLLVPRGWHVIRETPPSGSMIFLRGSEQLSWLPEWATEWMQSPRDGLLMLTSCPGNKPSEQGEDVIDLHRAFVVACRIQHGRGAILSYNCAPKMFHDTYRTILDSVKVL